MSDKPITNTTETLRTVAPALILHNLCTGELGKPGGFIESMEADGQREVVAQSSRLPSAGLLWSRHWGHAKPTAEQNAGYHDDDRLARARAAFEAMGIKILGEDPDDPIWCRVEVPAGWKIVAENHAMWSRLVDDKGRERAAIFYKAAFYDRSCHIGLQTRYSVVDGPETEHEHWDREHVRQSAVRDFGAPGSEPTYVYLTPKYTQKVDGGGQWTGEHAGDLASRDAWAWLAEHYPNHADPAAYWED